MRFLECLEHLAILAAQPRRSTVEDSLGLVRDALEGSDAYFVYAGDDEFLHITSGAALALSETQLWFVHRELTSGEDVRGFTLEGARIVPVQDGANASTCEYVAGLLGNSEGLGAMVLVHGPWTGDALGERRRFLRAAAPALALVLNGRLATAQADREQGQLSTIASISRVIAQGEQVETMLASIARTIATISAADVVTIDLIGRDGGIECRCVNYEPPSGQPDTWKLAKDQRDPVRERVIATREAIFAPDAQADERLSRGTKRFLTRVLLRSIAVLPLIARGEVVGVLALSWQRRTELVSSEIGVIEGLADQVANAVDGVRLIEARKEAEQALRESERNFRLLFADNPHPMWVFESATGRFLEVNTAAITHYGYSRDAFLSMTIADIRPPGDVAQLAEVTGADAKSHDSEWRHTLRDGRVIDVHVRANEIEFAGRKARLVVAEDITERKRSEAAQARLTAIIESTTDLVSIADRDLRRVYLNRAGRQMLELAEDDDLNTNVVDDRPEWAQTALVSQAIPSAIREGAWSGELAYLDRSGREIPVSQVVLCHKQQNGEVEFFSITGRDVSERKRIERQLEHLADHDPLTGLVNRRRLAEELDQRLVEARRDRQFVAVLLIDVDQFKDVNDSRGHIAGDELLAALADLLRDRLRTTDVISRQGGDEFVLVVSTLDCDAPRCLGEDLVRLIGEHSFTVGGLPLRVTVSIGLARFPEDGSNAGELLSRADLAMYRGKERGRNQLCSYEASAEWEKQTVSRLDWYQRIRDALEHDRFVLLAQPILDLRTQRVTSYELLLRMRSSRGELILPGMFLDTAERAGLIQEIDRWVACRAIRLLAEHQDAGGDITFEVNLSGKAFDDNGLLQTISAELTATGADPRNLIFEVTESAAISNLSEAQRFILTLKGLGCRFALDDFGIGFSSFNHLKHLAVDYLKIDGSFIRDLASSNVDQHLVKAMVGLARALGKTTIAEYVNDEATVRILQAYGVDYAQGYYIGRPGPIPLVTVGRQEAA